jgi:hypothetical protein
METEGRKPIKIRDLNLPQHLLNLISKIESKTGEKLVFNQYVPGPEISLIEAQAGIINGIPTIILSPSGFRNITILHELLHLELELLGYPRTMSLKSSQLFSVPMINLALTETGSLIEHKVIHHRQSRWLEYVNRSKRLIDWPPQRWRHCYLNKFSWSIRRSSFS